MLLTYIILALSASVAPLVSGLPVGPSPLDHPPTVPTEPGTLLGKPYSVQDRRTVLTYSALDATHPGDDYSRNAARRVGPYAKYLADRSDDSWVRVRERRADDSDMNVNYLSNVSAYSSPRPYAPPSPPLPPPAVRPPPTVRPPPVGSPPPVAPPPPVVIPSKPGTGTKGKSPKGKQAKKGPSSKSTNRKLAKSTRERAE